MKVSKFKASTALVASLSLATPHALFAQSMATPDQLVTICEPATDAEVCATTVADALEAGTVEVDADGQLVGNFTFEDGTLTIETPEVAAEAEVVVEAEAEPAAEVEAEPVAEAEPAAEPEPTAEAEPVAEPAAEPEAEVVVEAETEVEAEPATDAEPVAESEAVVEPESETTTEPEVAADADATAEPELTDAGEAVEDTGAKVVAAPEPAVEEVEQADTETSTELANEAPTVAASSDADAEPVGEVETVTVTEADVRASDEDFDTKANATAAPESNLGGLNNLEKFLVGAAGLAVVGALLKNGDKVLSNSGDRVVVQRDDGALQVLKDDDVLLRRPGAEVQTQTFNDGSTRSTVIRADGTQVITIRSATGQVLRRTRILNDGREIVLFDDTQAAEPVIISELPVVPLVPLNNETDELRAALEAQNNAQLTRRFTLQQVRQIRAVRELAPEIELSDVNFETGSAAIRATEAEELSDLGNTIRDQITNNPNEVFLIEGHTDAVGSASYNLALSDRRAESVALALTEYFNVPPENMIVQGYGEANLKVLTQADERQNRRAAVRRITPLLQSARLQ